MKNKSIGLKKSIDIDQDKIFSVIVFAGESEFKTKMPENVRQGIGYIDYIKSKTKKVLSKDEVSKIISQIESGRLTKSFKTHREHVKHVKDIIDKKSKQCPKCGSELVLRTAKKGANAGNQFYNKLLKCPYATHYYSQKNKATPQV